MNQETYKQHKKNGNESNGYKLHWRQVVGRSGSNIQFVNVISVSGSRSDEQLEVMVARG